MDGLNKTNCAFAQDGTCKLSADKCAECKIDRKTSDFHANLCIGALTWAQIERMQGSGKTRKAVKHAVV